MGIFLQPGANELEVGEAVRTRLKELESRFPQGFTYAIPFDTTIFVEVSIREVVITLLEAMLLVFLVVFLFLQNWRATLIPFAAVPVSLIGTFAGLLLLGYSINTLTLFGMVLAIGIVVDDAIVVLENVERIMHEEQLEPREAAIKAMKRGDQPDHRHRAGAVRGVHPDRLPRRPDRRALPPVRGHHLDRGGDLRHRRADAHAGAVCHCLEADTSNAPSRCLRLVQPRLRARHRPLRDGRRLDDPPRRRGAAAVRRHGAAHRLPVAHHARLAGARRGPGLVLRAGDPARRRVAAAHRQDGGGGDRRDPLEPVQRARDGVHRLRFRRRLRVPQERRHHLRHAEALGRAADAGGRAGGRVLRQDRAPQGRPGDRLPAAGDLRPGHRGRLRVLHPEPRRGRAQAPVRGDAAVHRRRLAKPEARHGEHLLARERAAALRRRRPREGQGARRAARRHLQHARRHARQLLRERLQQVRPHLAGADVGRAGPARPPGGRGTGLRAQRRRAT